MYTRKYCFVPSCKNASRLNRNKIFVCVPKDKINRDLWFRAIGHPTTTSLKSSVIHCCEDHFDLQNDMQNYMKYSYLGGKLYLKRDVVPHLKLDSTAITAKTCLAECCNNNTYNSPEKIFIRVPDKANIREIWFNALKVTNLLVNRTKFYVCEDHFDLEIDAENWLHYKLFSSRLMLKVCVIPHLYLDENDAPTTSQLTQLDRKRKYENIEKYRLNAVSKKTEHKQRLRAKCEATLKSTSNAAKTAAGSSHLRKAQRYEGPVASFEFIDVNNISGVAENPHLISDAQSKEEPSEIDAAEMYTSCGTTVIECKSEIVTDEIDCGTKLDGTYLQIKTEFASDDFS